MQALGILVNLPQIGHTTFFGMCEFGCVSDEVGLRKRSKQILYRLVLKSPIKILTRKVIEKKKECCIIVMYT